MADLTHPRALPSLGAVDASVNIPPKPIVDPFACPTNYRVNGISKPLADLLNPDGQRLQVDVVGPSVGDDAQLANIDLQDYQQQETLRIMDGGPYANVPLPCCPGYPVGGEADHPVARITDMAGNPFAPIADYRGQLVLGGLDPGIRA